MILYIIDNETKEILNSWLVEDFELDSQGTIKLTTCSEGIIEGETSNNECGIGTFIKIGKETYYDCKLTT